MVTVGAVFTDWVDWYSTCSRGAWAAAPSQERATRTPLPVPLTRRARALVGVHPGRLTIPDDALEVGTALRGAAVVDLVQDGTLHVTAAVVRPRDDSDLFVLLRAGASSAACACIVRVAENTN